MEQKHHNMDRWPEDPRTMLADSLREFGMRAIHQQAVYDEHTSDGRKIPGSLYKTDNGYLKVHLQAPAADKVFGDNDIEAEIPSRELPLIWILIPLRHGIENDESELEELILGANDLIVHVLEPGKKPLQFLVQDEYLGPMTPTFETLEDMYAYEPPALAEQVGAAKHWYTMIQNYDLRTIVSTDPQADVA